MFLKRRPILWLILPALALITAYIGLYINPAQIAGNRESALSSAALLLFISAPLASLCSALEASSERRSFGVINLATRSVFRRILLRTWPSILGAWIVHTYAVLFLLVKAGHSYGSYLPITLAGYYVAIALHSLCGYALGYYLPKILAICCALAGSYGWVAFAWTIEPVQVRYMAGPALALCCSPSGQLDIAPQWTLLLFSFFMTIAVCLGLAGLLAERGNKFRLAYRGGGAILAIAGIVSSFAVGKSADVIPEKPIAQERFSCAGSSPNVCLTDIQLSRKDNRSVLEQTFAELNRLGMPRINHVKPLAPGSNILLDGDTAFVVASPLSDTSEAVHSAATTFAYSVDLSTCPSENFEDLYIDQTIFAAWLDTRAATVLDSSSAQTLQENSKDQLLAFSGARETLEKVLSQDDSYQREWARTTYERLQSCDTSAAHGDNS